MPRTPRRDPYKNFNFPTLFGAAALGGLAIGLGSRLLAAFKRRKDKPPVVEEVSSGHRPIEAVGTSTASRTRTPRPAKGRRGSRTTSPRRKN